MEFLTAILLGVGLLLGGLLFLAVSISWVRRDDVSERMKAFVGEEKEGAVQRETSLQARRQEIRGSFLGRTLYPFMRRIIRSLGNLMPAARMANLDKKLSIAGNPLRLRSPEFSGLQLIVALLGVLLAYFVYRSDIQYALLLSILVIIFFLFMPSVWLNRRVRNRQNAIRKELPNIIDMLSICTSAGLSFDQSLQRVSDEWHTPLSAEFGRVVSEMEMGLTRREALRNLANRLDVNELSSFVSIIIQSDQLGMSISNTLHTLAAQMRVEWRFRAQEEARKVPVKILIPLVFFIFPAMLAVILGPSLPALMGLMGTLQ